MKILITGKHGMLGKNLIHLFKPNHEWTYIAREDCDLLDPVQVDRMFDTIKPDMVIHFAAVVGGVFMNINNKTTMFHDNVIMNENILYYAKKHNVTKGIFCLSTCVFPANPPSFPMTESMIMNGAPHQSNNAYAYAKRMMYLQCQNYNKEFNTKYVCISPCNMFGKFDNFNIENGHVIPALIHKFYIAKQQNSTLDVTVGRDTLRQFIHAEDVVKIVYKMVESFDSLTEHYILCNDEIKLIDVIDKIATQFDISYNIIDSEPGITQKTCTNTCLLQQFPDIEFSDFNTKLTETIEWFTKNFDTVRK